MEIEDRIKKILDAKGITYKTSTHPAVYTSEEAAKIRGVELKTGVKALVAKTTEGKFIMVLVRGDKRADLKRVAKLEKTKKVFLGTPEEVKETAGCEIGSVPPFGHPKPLKTYMDESILENEHVNFNIGSHTRSMTVKASDLAKAIGAIMF